MAIVAISEMGGGWSRRGVMCVLAPAPVVEAMNSDAELPEICYKNAIGARHLAQGRLPIITYGASI